MSNFVKCDDKKPRTITDCLTALYHTVEFRLIPCSSFYLKTDRYDNTNHNTLRRIVRPEASEMQAGRRHVLRTDFANGTVGCVGQSRDAFAELGAFAMRDEGEMQQ